MIDGTNVKLSNDTCRAIKDVLVQREKLDAHQLELITCDVERACRLSLTIDIPESPSAVRSELEALYQAFDKLFDAIRGLSHHSTFALWETARLDQVDSTLADYGEDKGPGYEFVKLARGANLIVKAVELTLAKIEVPKGTPPNIQGRHLAFHILVALDQQGVISTSYHDGTYFQILGHVFEEVMPEDSYIRHGRWALSNPVLEEHFMKSI